MAVMESYKNLALEWQPDSSESKSFIRLLFALVILFSLGAFWMERVKVPQVDRQAAVAVPERIAKFMIQREKQTPPKPKTPQPEKPKPLLKVQPRPKVSRERPSEQQKPLTQKQKAAREAVQDTGLLALSSQLNDLMDTADVDKMVSRPLSKGNKKSSAAGFSADIVTGAAAKSGGTVNISAAEQGVGHTLLAQRQAVNSAALKAQELAASDDRKAQTQAGDASSGRASEDISLVFDRNKGGLYSIYERERRKTPGLQGKIVFEITISPKGDVLKVRVLSSSLNSKSLEYRILSRIKQFKFKPNQADKPVVVNYPVEFLPS